MTLLYFILSLTYPVYLFFLFLSLQVEFLISISRFLSVFDNSFIALSLSPLRTIRFSPFQCQTIHITSYIFFLYFQLCFYFCSIVIQSIFISYFPLFFLNLYCNTCYTWLELFYQETKMRFMHYRKICSCRSERKIHRSCSQHMLNRLIGNDYPITHETHCLQSVND